MIEYIKGSNGVVVKLDGKWIGTIERASLGESLGWRYRPKGSNKTGETFATLRECKKSLEGEE